MKNLHIVQLIDHIVQLPAFRTYTYDLPDDIICDIIVYVDDNTLF